MKWIVLPFKKFLIKKTTRSGKKTWTIPFKSAALTYNFYYNTYVRLFGCKNALADVVTFILLVHIILWWSRIVVLFPLGITLLLVSAVGIIIGWYNRGLLKSLIAVLLTLITLKIFIKYLGILIEVQSWPRRWAEAEGTSSGSDKSSTTSGAESTFKDHIEIIRTKKSLKPGPRPPYTQYQREFKDPCEKKINPDQLNAYIEARTMRFNSKIFTIKKPDKPLLDNYPTAVFFGMEGAAQVIKC